MRAVPGSARRVGWAVLLALPIAGCVGEGPRSPPPRAGESGNGRGVPSLHLLLRIRGKKQNGELGFRFSSPRDVDGDGIADIAAGARFTDLEFPQMGTVGVWSSAGGKELARWEGDTPDALFGHAVLVGPDAGGDGRPDIIASAPTGKHREVYRGVIHSLSPIPVRRLWSTAGEPGEALGWHLAIATDHNQDGVEDLFAGAPGNGALGMAYLLDGRTGSILRAYASSGSEDQFGWYVSEVADLDGDGLGDLLVGAPSTEREGAPAAGAAYAISSARGLTLRAWYGRDAGAQLGEVVAGLSDLDGDGLAEVAVSATFHPYLVQDRSRVGEVVVFSGATGREVHRFRGRQPFELYGRMIAAAGDVDGDRVADIAIGAPWSLVDGKERAGRFEVRSGRSGRVLLEACGERAEMWLGWHIAAAEDLGAARERGLVVSALRSEEEGLSGAGALLVYVLRSRGAEEPGGGGQGVR